MRYAFGSLTITLPIATLCFWPPDSACGFLSSRWAISRIFAACLTRLSISSFGVFRTFSPKAIF